MSAITEALDSIRAKENKDKADRQQLVRRARKHRQSDTKGAMGWFSAPAGGLSLEGIGSRKEVIAYHGSQSADLKLSDEYSLYLTSSKDVASDFARGSAFNYRLTKDDNPTVYTMRVRLDNPLVLHSEGEYDRYMDASNNRTVIPELKDNGFDGIVYSTDRETYYEVFSPESQLVILNRQSADAMREEAGTSQASTSVSLTESKADIQSFIDKFGEDTYDTFKKSSQRLKNAGMSADMLTYVHDDSMSKDKLDRILFNLANHIKTVKSDMSKIGGEYKYLGSAKGYDVYQPLDAESSMNLGVGSGWCTTGRYGHYGEDNFNPSLKDAKKHWNDYTSKGVKFFYFLQHGKGKYALALYPKILDVEEFIPGYYLKQTNVELYDAPDNLDYKDLNKLPLDMIPEKIVLDMTKLKKDDSGKLTLSEDGKTLVRVDRDIVEAVIPDSVTSISNYAFYKCSSLKSVTIPSTVTSIGKYAFSSCSSIKSIAIPNSVTSIGADAFYNCSSLESIVIPDSVTSIGTDAFRDCSSLKSVTIPNSVTSIGGGAFSRCSSLKSVNIPNSVTSIGDSAFYGCSSLKSITVGPKLYDQLNLEYGDIVILHDGSNGMSEAYRWHPSRTAAREFVQKMDDINDFCNENGIRMSRNGDSYYFTLNDRSYRVSNHSVEASNRGAYNSDGVKVRNLYHPGGREDDVIYINAGKTRIEQIYNDLKAGYELDGNGRRNDGTVYHSPESIAKAQVEDSYAKWEKIVTDPTGKFNLQGYGTILADVIDKNATKLVIPDGVRQFDYRVFMDCPNLDTLVIPNSATLLSARGLESIPHIILHKDAPQELKNRFIGASRHRASWIEEFHITFE